MLGWLAAVLLLASTGVAAQTTASPDSLELTVRLDSKTYVVNDSIEMEIVVTNRGEGPVAFWAHFNLAYQGTLDYIVRRMDGTEVRNSIMVDRIYLGELEPPQVLEPGESVQKMLDLYVRHLVKEPGKYVLEMTYLAPDVSRDEVEIAYPLWTRDSGTLTGSAEFEVVER